MNKMRLISIICLLCKCAYATSIEYYQVTDDGYMRFLSDFLGMCGTITGEQKVEVAECAACMFVNRQNNTFNDMVHSSNWVRIIYWKDVTSTGNEKKELAEFYRKNAIDVCKQYIGDDELLCFIVCMHPGVWNGTDENNKLVRDFMKNIF